MLCMALFAVLTIVGYLAVGISLVYGIIELIVRG